MVVNVLCLLHPARTPHPLPQHTHHSLGPNNQYLRLPWKALTPSSLSLSQAAAKSLKKSFSSLAYSSAILRIFSSCTMARSVASIMSDCVLASSNCAGPVHLPPSCLALGCHFS